MGSRSCVSPTPSVLVVIHPSTNRDQGIRDSGYLYWFYVLSCCMAGSLIFVEIANSPKEMSRAFNLCCRGQYRNPAPSARCYCTEPERFQRFHDTSPAVKKKKWNPSKSLRGRLRWPLPLCGSGYLRSMSIWGKRHLKNRLCTFKALNGQTVRSLRKQQQKQNKTKQRFWVNLSIISSMLTLKV